MGLLRGIYFWVMAITVTVICFGAICLGRCGEQLGLLAGEGRSVHSVASFWGRLIVRLMPGWRVEVTGFENLPPPDQHVVVVANHESMADICAIYFINVQFRWLSKDTIFKIPLIGTAMRWAGYVSVKRGDKNSAVDAMRVAHSRLRQGLSMFFFPEGTRSMNGFIKPFKLGAFKLAQEEQIPVLLVALHGAGNLLPKGSWIPGKATVKVSILPALRTPMPDEGLNDYAEVARTKIKIAHDLLV